MHDRNNGWGVTGLVALADFAAHNAFTLLTVCGLLFQVARLYLDYRNGDARLARLKLRWFREWEAQRDKGL